MHRFSSFWTFWKPFDPIQHLRGLTFWILNFWQNWDTLGMAATLLFVFETLYRVYALYQTTNGRSVNGSKKRKKRKITSYCDDLCQRISQQISACHDLYC